MTPSEQFKIIRDMMWCWNRVELFSLFRFGYPVNTIEFLVHTPMFEQAPRRTGDEHERTRNARLR